MEFGVNALWSIGSTSVGPQRFRRGGEFGRGRKNDTAAIYLSAKWVIDIMVDGLKCAAAPRGPRTYVLRAATRENS